MIFSRIFRFKWNNISRGFLWYFTIFLFVFLNYNALVNSGVLLSGGAEFNGELKYTLLTNNFLSVSSLYGLILAVYMGAGMIGPDLVSGNIYVILTVLSDKWKYYLYSYLSGLGLYFLTYLGLCGNYMLLLQIFELPVRWQDFEYLFFGILLNAMVIYSVTALFSIFMKGYKSILAGLVGYSFFYVYTFNQIPFVNGVLSVPISRFGNWLFLFFPMKHLLVPSVTDVMIIELYNHMPHYYQEGIYQLVYCVITVCIGMVFIKRRNF